MGSADFFMRHRALPWPVPSIRLRIWFVTVVPGAITLQIPALRAQTTSTTEGIVADQQGLPVAGAEIHVLNSGMGIDRSAKSESDGTYRVLGLLAGTYTVTVFKTGFVPTTVRNLQVTVNQTVTLNLSLKLGGQTEKVEVSGVAPLLESTTSSSGTTILPQQIEQMPINGRNYLDLLQLVPGVAINRQQDPSLDSATPILGERGGNAIFLIDGMPNRDEVNGGAAAQFNQDSILEFQVLTGSYKSEFGHGSVGVINVVSQQFNLTNTHVTDYLPLLAAINLPSTRNNFDTRRLMLGFNDTSTLGDQARPYLLNVFVQYRGEPAVTRPAHPEAGTASTLDNLFSGLSTGQLFGDQGQVQFGPGHTNLLIDQKYVSIGANLAKQIRRHDVKFGWDFQRTHVDGIEANNLFNQLFATIDDLGTFGPVSSGVYFLNAQGGLAASDNTIRLRNNYNGTFLQDDWRVVKNVTLNLGLRWDYDNEFPNKTNFSPRLGFAWSITPKTVVRASWGLFYDHFRLGLARDIPGFGGANLEIGRA